MANKALLASLSLVFTIFITFPFLSTAVSSYHQLGTLSCKGKSFPQFSCSPPVTSATKAKLTNNDFSEGGDGGGASKCDGKFHCNSEPMVALSTGWFNGWSRCGRKIKITTSNGKSVMATVVDECDSLNGCDDGHAGQPPW